MEIRNEGSLLAYDRNVSVRATRFADRTSFWSVLGERFKCTNIGTVDSG